MKKILFLLLFTIASYGQAVFDEGIQITNTESTTATKVNVQEANGKVNTKTINTAFNKNFGLNSGDVVGATTLLNQYSTTPIDWTSTSFSSGQVVFYGGKQWIAKMATVAADVPAVSQKWEEITFEAIANKTTSVDQTIIDGSTNAVSGNAVFDGLATKAPISSVHNPVTLGTANGLSLATQQLSLGLASSSTTGALSGTDWNNFNSKFNTPTGLTTNYLPKWNGSGFGNSIASEVGSNIGINAIPTDGVGTQNFEMINGSVLASRSAVPQLYISSNAVGQAFSATRKVDGFATQYVLQGFDGSHSWNTAISGLAGSSISWVTRMTLNNRGALLVNTPTDNGVDRVQVAGTISASPAVNSNQVVVKSQLDAVVAKPYKVYTALLSQTGTNAPVATVLENTLGGTVVWSRNNVGVYFATLNGSFIANKTVVFVTPANNGGNNYFLYGKPSNINSCTLQVFNTVGQSTDGLFTDVSIEIRVYN